MTVCSPSDCVRLVLSDWCQCYRGQPQEKIIDLYWDVWSRIDAGQGRVTISW